MTNDPIEELFRNEVLNNDTTEKPSKDVWNKIAKDLPTNKPNLVKDFVQSVWFAAAVFGLIAIPYFYFFIENLNQSTNANIELVNEIVKHQLHIPQQKNETKTEDPIFIEPTIGKESEPIKIVKNTTVPKSANEILSNEEEIMIESKSLPSPRMNAAILSNKSKTILMDSKDSIKIDSSNNFNYLLAKQADNPPVKDSITKHIEVAKISKHEGIVQASSSTQNHPNSNKGVIKMYRNKFSYIDKVHKVSFELIKKTENEQKFKSGDVEFKLIKENGQIIFSTNSKNIKQEIINQIFLNKEKIFNNYMNRKDFSNIR